MIDLVVVLYQINSMICIDVYMYNIHILYKVIYTYTFNIEIPAIYKFVNKNGDN